MRDLLSGGTIFSYFPLSVRPAERTLRIVQRQLFVNNGSGGCNSPAGEFGSLTHNTDGTFTFDRDGFIMEQSDSNGMMTSAPGDR